MFETKNKTIIVTKKLITTLCLVVRLNDFKYPGNIPYTLRGPLHILIDDVLNDCITNQMKH